MPAADIREELINLTFKHQGVLVEIMNRTLKEVDPEIFSSIEEEKGRQNKYLELIASENFVSRAVLEAMGSVMTNKYAEGYPGKRYYGGCVFVDKAETLAIERAKELFGADHVNVQPHSGSQANTAVYFSLLKPGDTMLGMNLFHGGHLTHGHPINFSGVYFNIVQYGVNRETEKIDYDEMRELALKHRPKLMVVGASAYSRTIDFERIGNIAQEAGCPVMADIAHIAGLIAGGQHPSPIPHCDFVTTTTHKTLRGPRGGMVMCKEKYAKELDKAVFPGIQGGPLMHVIASKAVCFHEALSREFREYQAQIVRNASALCGAMQKNGFRIVSGGTDNHLFLVDVFQKNITGKAAEHALEEAGITVNKNTIPFDGNSPFVTSGIRIGTSAVTTRGMKEPEMGIIADLISRALSGIDNNSLLEEVKHDVQELCGRFPLYK